tara:strand:+ start:431 stop:601 length:171 start_codon:yes stop_codon:yes gene_type:complete
LLLNSISGQFSSDPTFRSLAISAVYTPAIQIPNLPAVDINIISVGDIICQATDSIF